MNQLSAKLAAICAKSEGLVGVHVKHIERGETAEVNADELFPLCSTFKVPILVELMRRCSIGECSLEDRVELDARIQVGGSGVFAQMRPGLRPTLHDCALLMIVISDNTATDILLRHLGVDRVGKLLRDLGLNNTHINHTCRDLIFGVSDVADKTLTNEQFNAIVRGRTDYKPDPDLWVFKPAPPNNVGSPRDHTRLYELIWSGVAVFGDFRDATLDILLKQQLNGRLPRYLPKDVKFAHKTGSLPTIKNDAGIMYVADSQHVIVSAFSRGFPDSGRPDKNDDLLGEIGRAVYDHYAS